MDQEQVDRLKAQVPEYVNVSRQAEHLRISNYLSRLENEVNDPTRKDVLETMKELADARQKAEADHKQVDKDHDAQITVQQAGIEKDKTGVPDKALEEGIQHAIEGNKVMTMQQLEAARHLQEQLKEQQLNRDSSDGPGGR